MEQVSERINEYTYRLKKVKTPYGELREFSECDKNVEFILNWAGTGESKKFKDIMEEHLQYTFDWSNKNCDEEYVRLVDYIVAKNYNIIFESGDIIIRNHSKIN